MVVSINDANACTYTLNVIISDASTSCFFVPNGFTPNGDGINDYWKLPEIGTYGQVEVTVYNRYGQPVYRSDSYKNDWDGTWDGYPLPSASYYYIIKSAELGIIKGVVNIVR